VQGAFIIAAIAAGYGGFMWLLLRWARSRVTRRAEAASGALERAGGRIVAIHPCESFRGPARVEAVLGDQPVEVVIRQYSRDYILQSVRIPTGPLPLILVRAERGLDRLGKTLGLDREVQLGDDAFDNAAYIESSASDDTVRSAFASAETRAQVRALLALGYSLDMSGDGLSATRLRGYYSAFEFPELPDVLRTLKAIHSALPKLTGEPGAKRRMRVSAPVLVSFVVVLIGIFSLAWMGQSHFGGPLDDLSAAKVLGLGVFAWAAISFALYLALRNRPMALQTLLFSSLLLIFGIPPLFAFGVLLSNSSFDSAPATVHRTKVVYLSPRSHEVRFTAFRTERPEDKVAVPFDVYRTLNVGDDIEVDTRPGAFGITWVSGLRRLGAAPFDSHAAM